MTRKPGSESWGGAGEVNEGWGGGVGLVYGISFR